ncbi:uncharacterized protein LOC116197484 [Punica granatum]|uniref:Uncharacterized protein LOC116197484 n=2 Tax=Punica granatum TaxID=22663 RepID=A0A6P8CMA8_PUNGR|nr:uncharacterized protein LOC116197484 [Punica granatum]PKI32883.1 hypothetical protein CRG98_046725 [Punica granatum]
MDYRGDWMNDTRGTLMMVASIIATVTLQAGIVPPGGMWQQDIHEGLQCSSKNICYAGEAVLTYYYPIDFMYFLICDMISFLGSLAVILLLICGFPISNKFCLWLLSLAMSVTVSSFGPTFFNAVWQSLATPLQRAQVFFNHRVDGDNRHCRPQPSHSSVFLAARLQVQICLEEITPTRPQQVQTCSNSLRSLEKGLSQYQ